MAKTLFDAPIAGQSLTAEVGARPWQQPAQFSTVEEAFEFYAPKIADPKLNDSLLDALEMGLPVSSIAELVVQSGAMEGKHTIDVSILLLPVIMELIAYIADEAGIEYSMGVDTKIDQDIIPESKIAASMQRLKIKSPKDSMKEEATPMADTEDTSEEVPEPSGLMSRRM